MSDPRFPPVRYAVTRALGCCNGFCLEKLNVVMAMMATSSMDIIIISLVMVKYGHHHILQAAQHGLKRRIANKLRWRCVSPWHWALNRACR
eukprot:4560760-Amphidinium_carterae.1